MPACGPVLGRERERGTWGRESGGGATMEGSLEGSWRSPSSFLLWLQGAWQVSDSRVGDGPPVSMHRHCAFFLGLL